MFNFWTVLYLIIVGLIAGYLARLLLKGANPMTWWQTMLSASSDRSSAGSVATCSSAGTTTKASSSRAV